MSQTRNNIHIFVTCDVGSEALDRLEKNVLAFTQGVCIFNRRKAKKEIPAWSTLSLWRGLNKYATVRSRHE